LPLHLAFSYDEEVGCVGVRSLVQDMETWTLRPRLCIVGEPTMMKIAVGHKGKTALKVVCKGVASHSALAPRGLNAIHLASDFVQGVRALQTELQTSGPREAGYDIPYSTVHVGRIGGGTALNIVPDRCELEVEIRNIATDPAERIFAAIRAEAARIAANTCRPDATAQICVEITNEYPGLSTADSSSVVEYVARLTRDPDLVRVAFGSEAGLFSGIGIPTVLCGPGSITQAHRADEFVTKEQLARCEAMMSGLIETLV
jgi:acetylornithine deacetylase